MFITVEQGMEDVTATAAGRGDRELAGAGRGAHWRARELARAGRGAHWRARELAGAGMERVEEAPIRKSGQSRSN
jgi:hypothetical protein